ncbi:MAG: hypothetical protein ABJM36_09685 [Algibacter sp.]|uniref:hypothetical protein n=1 Tax=Algibacter sp. TaxID=1872428 RepID=UPI003296EEF5
MKNIKLLTLILLTSIFSFTSCQDEIDIENGDRTNTNNASSPTASNLERTSMYDGSFDDFLDGISCSSILLPVTATINNTEITILNESQYNLVLDILGSIINDEDSIEFQFPISVMLSNYTEVQIANQTEYDALIDACTLAEQNNEDPISCLDINFPITILTYSLNLEQTGRVIIDNEQQLYTYINNLSNDDLFSINYPITATLNNDTNVEITNDTDLSTQINECLGVEANINDAKEDAKTLEGILVEGLFKIESFTTSGTDTANLYANYTIDFANDLTCTAENSVNPLSEDVQGTYTIASELDVFLSLTFSENAMFQLLNHKWEVTSYSDSSIALQSTTNTAIALVLSQI